MKVILIDSSALVFQAFYKYGLANNKDMPVAVIFGFIEKILSLADHFQTPYFIFCFDSKIRLRRKLFSEYKKKYQAQSEEDIIARKLMKQQESELRIKTLRKIGFRNIYLKRGFEADDILTYLAKKLSFGHRLLMVTNDRDMYQCLDYCDIIDPKTLKAYTRKKFEKDYGIKPDQWAEAKSIGGCSSDNVPGIKGVSDPKNKSSKALSYLRNELTKGLVYQRITSDEGKGIIARNRALVECPLFNKNFNLDLKEDLITQDKIENVLLSYNFSVLLKGTNYAKWKIFAND